MNCCFRENLNEGWIELGTGSDEEGDINDRAICQHSPVRQMVQSTQIHVFSACLMGVSTADMVWLLKFKTFEYRAKSCFVNIN